MEHRSNTERDDRARSGARDRYRRKERSTNDSGSAQNVYQWLGGDQQENLRPSPVTPRNDRNARPKNNHKSNNSLPQPRMSSVPANHGRSQGTSQYNRKGFKKQTRVVTTRRIPAPRNTMGDAPASHCNTGTSSAAPPRSVVEWSSQASTNKSAWALGEDEMLELALAESLKTAGIQSPPPQETTLIPSSPAPPPQYHFNSSSQGYESYERHSQGERPRGDQRTTEKDRMIQNYESPAPRRLRAPAPPSQDYSEHGNQDFDSHEHYPQDQRLSSGWSMSDTSSKDRMTASRQGRNNAATKTTTTTTIMPDGSRTTTVTTVTPPSTNIPPTEVYVRETPYNPPTAGSAVGHTPRTSSRNHSQQQRRTCTRPPQIETRTHAYKSQSRNEGRHQLHSMQPVRSIGSAPVVALDASDPYRQITRRNSPGTKEGTRRVVKTIVTRVMPENDSSFYPRSFNSSSSYGSRPSQHQRVPRTHDPDEAPFSATSSTSRSLHIRAPLRPKKTTIKTTTRKVISPPTGGYMEPRPQATPNHAESNIPLMQKLVPATRPTRESPRQDISDGSSHPVHREVIATTTVYPPEAQHWEPAGIGKQAEIGQWEEQQQNKIRTTTTRAVPAEPLSNSVKEEQNIPSSAPTDEEVIRSPAPARAVSSAEEKDEEHTMIDASCFWVTDATLAPNEVRR